MFKEIYIDNFRCLSNFRIQPSFFQLWLGSNGSGKTSVLDALRCIRRTAGGDHVQDIFPESSLTLWDKRSEQTFGVNLELDGEPYEYELVIEHQRGQGRCRIQRERLIWKGQTFFLFAEDQAQLYRINRTTAQVEEGTQFPANPRRSVMPTIAERDDNMPLLYFRRAIENWSIVQPVPVCVEQIAEGEARNLSRYAENFAKWYRHVLQENPGIGYRARESLKEALPGFEELSLRESGDVRRLTATFRTGKSDHVFDFKELSDGQRQLCVLYTILESLRQGSFSVLLIDEPDNFVSLREIEPWIVALQEICEDNGRQAIVISHHPEVINKMARGTELWFSRKGGGHVATGQFPTTPGLTPAETMARGWEGE